MTKIDTTSLGRITLRHGAQFKPVSPDGDISLCVMQAVAYITGAPLEASVGKDVGAMVTAHPPCVDKTLTRFAIVLNDTLPDDELPKLKLRIPRFIDTRNDGHGQDREVVIAEYLLHEAIPTWAAPGGAGNVDQDRIVAAIRAIPPIRSIADVRPAGDAISNILIDNPPPKHGNPDHFLWRTACQLFATQASGTHPQFSYVMDRLGYPDDRSMLNLLDRMLAVSDTPISKVELAPASFLNNEAASSAAIFLDVAQDIGYTPFPAPAPTSFVSQAY